jgi:DNA/RNA-binding domain of Phe-tRNA-synthetase-like protein
MVKVRIEEDVRKAFPSVRLGCMNFRAEVKESDPQFWKELDEQTVPEVQKKIEGLSWSEIPGVKGSRQAYKAFGRNPGRYRVSSEALLRRIRRGDELYHVNSVVDVNNLISITSGLSVGSYDLNHISGDIVLRKGQAGEGYEGIGKDFLDMENMLVLADEEGIFGSSMSDSRRTMVGKESRNILVVIYCFEDEIDLDAVLKTGQEAFERYAGAEDVTVWTV